MLMQTNAYNVPADRRDRHERLMRKFADAFRRIGASFEVYEQVGSTFNPADESTGRFVQVMRFRDRHHLHLVRQFEESDPTAQAMIAEFCELVDIASQQQRGAFLPGYYFGLVGRPDTDLPEASPPSLMPDDAPPSPDNSTDNSTGI